MKEKKKEKKDQNAGLEQITGKSSLMNRRNSSGKKRTEGKISRHTVMKTYVAKEKKKTNEPESKKRNQDSVD